VLAGRHARTGRFVCPKEITVADKKPTKKELEERRDDLAADHPEPNRLPNDQLVVTGDTAHPEIVVDHVTNETELADPKDEENYAGGPEYRPK
jgi:hypothetical protein